jgi:hypothetical protein
MVPQGCEGKRQFTLVSKNRKPSRTEGRRKSRLIAPYWEPHPLSRIHLARVGRLAWASTHFLMLLKI